MANASARQPSQALGKRTFWTEFFALYESLPALWDLNDPLYKDRQSKSQGYEMLVMKMREIDPYACREDVLRKINIFRTNYRRECARIKASNRMGKRYTTSLWYFHMLNFLQNQEFRKDRKRGHDDEKKILRRVANKVQPAQSRTVSMKSHVSSTHDTSHTPEDNGMEDNRTEQTKYEYLTDNENEVEEHLEEVPEYADERSFQQQFHNQFQTVSFMSQPNNIKTPIEVLETDTGDYHEIINIEDSMQSQEEMIEEIEHVETVHNKDEVRVSREHTPTIENLKEQPQITTRKTLAKIPMVQLQVRATERQPQTNSPAISEASEILAKSWAIQYEEMSVEQRIYARKAIAEILFEGCMGNLGRKRNIQRKASAATDAVVSSQYELKDEDAVTEHANEENNIIHMEDDNHTYIYAGAGRGCGGASAAATVMHLK